MEKLIIADISELNSSMEKIEGFYEQTDLYWSKEGNTYSLYSQGQEAYSKPLAVIEVA